jgi:alkylhydroperoxidase/carboxymuconolactone decarboxylase family protein YurZ
MSQTARFQETLRRLAMIDETFVEDAAGTCLGPAGTSALEPGTVLLLQLGALVATGASPECVQWSTGRAMAAGVADDEIADVLLAVAPVAGIGRVFSAAPEVAIALGYDVAAALEELDDHCPADTRLPQQAHDGRESLSRIVNSLFHIGLSLHAVAGNVPGAAARESISDALQRLDQAICEIRRHALCAGDHESRPHPAPGMSGSWVGRPAELSCRVRPGKWVKLDTIIPRRSPDPAICRRKHPHLLPSCPSSRWSLMPGGIACSGVRE